MLQIQHIRKQYKTGKLVQKALDDVSLNLRDNEFVAILGPSGSGKTTLLNIIGGLDRYDSGDLIINGISTKQYKDRDWDSYRNHTIGFVFQSYNLIPHQSILANVELALTISGIGKNERKRRAKRALEQVGLGEQLHKKPNQLSGGQMQRVAIARALVNDPDILLADEPTGALDSDTSVQVMELLQEVAKDRLVVMVTHNPELADMYATRIVRIQDGKIQADTDPFELRKTEEQVAVHKNMGKSSMNFWTALSLSFNNLKTKKARTLLTSFAGSIGIIGIALILSLSTGVNDYIHSVEEETLSEYPLQIQSTGLDFSAMLGGEKGEKTKKTGDVGVVQMVTNMFSTMDSNDLKSLKTYLEKGDSGIKKYTNAIEYSYQVVPQIYRQDGETVRQVNPDKSFDALGLGSSSGANSMMSSMMSTDVFYEMPEQEKLYKNQYDVKAGRWPKRYDECVVVLTSNGSISDFMLYTLGLRDSVELDDMIRSFINEETIHVPDHLGTYSYKDLLGIQFKLVNSSDYYEYDEQYNVWKDKSENEEYMKDLVANGEDLTIVGVVQPAKDANAVSLSAGIGYPASLTKHVVEEAKKSEIVKQQLASQDKDVFTNEAFGQESQNGGIDLNSLITVDTDALQKAFGFDEGVLTEGMSNALDFTTLFQSGSSMIDLSKSLNLGNIKIDLPDTGQMNLEDLIGNLDIHVSSDGMNKMASSLLDSYKEYLKKHPDADFSKLGEALKEYLSTDEAQQIIKVFLQDLLFESGNVTVSQEQMKGMFTEILQGYQNYAEEKGYTDADLYDEYLLEYLSTDEAQQIIDKWGNKIFQINPDFTISAEKSEQLASDLLDGYVKYANDNHLPTPGDASAAFLEYLNTEEGKQAFVNGISGIIDMESAEKQIENAVESYMKSAMDGYTGAISQTMETQISSAMQQVVDQIGSAMETAMKKAMENVGSNLETNMKNFMQIDPDAFADAFQMNMSEEDLTELLMSFGTKEDASFDGNLRKLGYADFSTPESIDIYPIDFACKEQVVRILDDYNKKMEREGKEEQVITYTDMVGTLMSSVTDIIDTISYVLIAFVAISLIVSSIMIGVITYISVLERKKEIGILRAIGASKGNISQVFNAETVIIGFCAGVIGIGLTLLILIPGNALIHRIADSNEVNAVLPVLPALILILLSIGLTFLGGLIPARKAAKSDPVTALRTE